MIDLVLKFVSSVILTETITEIITKSVIFSPVREFFFNRRKNKLFNWFHELLDCGYCTSVWIGWFFALLFFNNVNFLISNYIDWFFIGMIIHRLSNILHNIFDKIYTGKELNDFNGQGKTL